MKKILHHTGTVLMWTAIVGLLYPLWEMQNPLATYQQVEHWLMTFIVVLIGYPVGMYFSKINPRKMYYCLDVCTVTVEMLLATGLFIAALLFCAVMEAKLLQVLVLVSAVVVYLFLIFFFGHHGVAVYECGKIRIFRFGLVRTYVTDAADEVRLDYIGRKCAIHIVVAGEDHVFRVSSAAAKLQQKQLDAIPQKKYGK